MSSHKMIEALNNQLSIEAYASMLYMSMSIWSDHEGYAGCTRFMTAQAEEERDHMMRIVDYLSKIGAKAIIPGIPQPPQEFDSIKSMFELVFEQEKNVSESIFRLMKLADLESDYTSQVFLEWYIEEQKEEEDSIRTILDRIKLIGDGPHGNYFIDIEVDKFLIEQQKNANLN